MLPAHPMRVPSLLLLSVLVAVPSIADASGGSRPGGRGSSGPRRPVPQRDRQPPPRDVGELQLVLDQVMTPAEQGAIVRAHQRARRQGVQQRGGIFRRVVDGQRQNEYVVHQDGDVTAFLDMSDSEHPKFDPEAELEEGDELARVRPDRRAHILVVPNAPREHITRTIGQSITEADIDEVKAVMSSARQLAARLRIKNPRIYMNPESRVTMGYLHVHIIGERTSPYPAARP